jgi:dTDP-L-rhamnose 4-epimerase
MTSTCLITGGCGFIGRYLTAELQAKGYSVRIIDSLVDQAHGGGAAKPPSGVDFIEADLRDRDAMARALDGADYVFHLAAEVGVGQSMYEIERYVGGNDLATAVLLELMIDRPVRRIVVASSMSVYGEGFYADRQGNVLGQVRRKPDRVKLGLWEPVDAEEGPLNPVPTTEDKPVDLASIYALTKYMQERAVLIFGAAYGIEAVALRLFNVFGPGQALSNPYTGVLANFSSRLTNGQRPMIFEDGAQKRDFVHVRDVARAFRLALEEPQAAGEVINIGSGRAYSVSEVAARLAEVMGRPDLPPEIMGKARAGDIRNCFADIGKARRLLGFEPQHELVASLPELVAWVRTAVADDRAAEMRRQLEARGLVT